MGYRPDGSEHILDPVVQFGVDQMLQLVRSLALLGLDPRLDEQRVGVDAGLLQRQFEAVVLGRQRILERLVLIDDRLLLLGIEHGLQEQRLGVHSRLLKLIAQLLVLLGQRIVRGDHRRHHFQCPLADHFLELANHLLDFERLGEEAAVVGLVGIGDRDLPRDQDDLDVGPAGMNRMGELQPVHAAGHLNVGEQQRNVVARFEHLDGLVGAYGLDRHEPGIFNDVHGAHPQDHFVFDDQDDRWRIRRRHG